MFFKSRDFKTIQILRNITYAILLKGGGLLVSLISLPLYVIYFNDNYKLGIWFTVVSVFSWLITFDVGVSNGLRNMLVEPLKNKDTIEIRKLISSGYFITGIITLVILIGLYPIINSFELTMLFNVDSKVVSEKELITAVTIISIGLSLQLFLKIVNSIYFAMQMSFIPSLIILIGSTSILIFLLINNLYFNFSSLIVMACIFASFTIIPYVIATIYLFQTKLKNSKPKLKYVKKSYMKKIITLGLSFFYLQLITLLIFNSNEVLISLLFEPTYVVDYQIYNKYYSLFSTLFSLALTPVWSAVTEAIVLKDTLWIKKLIKKLNLFLLLLLPIYFLSILVFPLAVKYWLNDIISLKLSSSLYFIIFNVMFVKLSIDTAIVAGFGKLKFQAYSLTIVLTIKFLVIYCFMDLMDSWEQVVFINALALIPYFFISHFDIKNKIRKLEAMNS